jgi:hypothetical protein
MADLDFPNWFELKDLFELSVVHVKFSSNVLQQELVEVLHANVVISLPIIIVLRLNLR